MAIANVGVQLARLGKKVLLVDWDLEAPGLHLYFQSHEEAMAAKLAPIHQPADPTGLLGLLAEASALKRPTPALPLWASRCTQFAVSKSPPYPGSKFHFLSSGFGSHDYTENLQRFSWESFYANDQGGDWLESLREEWLNEFDFILIDSRTGLTDSGGVCTVQMPDILVFVFTPNLQSLDDGLRFLNAVQRERANFPYERSPLTIIPLLARWEGDREVDLSASWLERISKDIEPLVETWLPSDRAVRRMLERLRVPHVARFSFGEPLPVLTHSLSDPDLPGLSYDLLANLLASGLADAGKLIEPYPESAYVEVTELDLEEILDTTPFKKGSVKLSGDLLPPSGGKESSDQGSGLD